MKELAALVLLGAAALAQEPLREGSFGEVRGADKKPFAGATVHLLHRAHPGVLDPAYEDHVVATADERGQFKVQLLVGMPYAVWAVGPVVDGTYRCSKVLSDVVPGVPIVLHEGELHYVRKLTFAVDPSWTQPLRFQACSSAGANVLQAPLALVDGRIETPAWPADQISIVVLEGDVPVLAKSVATTMVELGLDTASPDTAGNNKPLDDVALQKTLTGVTEIDVPPRREYAVKFVDRSAKPLAGIELFAASSLPRARLGVSDTNGVLRTAVAGQQRPSGSTTATAAGFAESRVTDSDFSTGDSELRAVTLAPGVAVHGRLLLGDNRPVPRAALLLHAVINFEFGRSWFPDKECALLGADDGAFTVPGRLPGVPFRLVALLTPAQRTALSPDKSAPPLWPRAIVFPESGRYPRDLGDIRLDKLAVVDVQVVAADHSPPVSVDLFVVVAARRDDAELTHEPEYMRTDRHGRTRFLVPFRGEIAVIAMTEHGAAFGVVTPERRKLELILDPLHAVRLRIVDDRGEPLPHATAIVIAETPADAPGAARFAVPVRNAFLARAFPWTTDTADTGGCVRFVLPLPGVGIELMVVVDGKTMRATIPIPPDRGSAPIEVVFMPDKH